MGIIVGDTVRVAGGVTGVVAEIRSSRDIAVNMLPSFWGQEGTEVIRGYDLADLTVVKVCACAHLGYRDSRGQVFTTGCDLSRRPSAGRDFLPGHDAKAKSFLTKAALSGAMGDQEAVNLAQRKFGDKIAAKVAEGIHNGQVRQYKRAASRRPRQKVAPTTPRPAVREDLMDEADRLQKQLGVTEAMMRLLAHGITEQTPSFQGRVFGPTGSLVALAKRKLTSWDHITDLGYKVMRQPTLAESNPDAVVCRDGEGGYSDHAWKWDEERYGRFCRRCDAEHEDN